METSIVRVATPLISHLPVPNTDTELRAGASASAMTIKSDPSVSVSLTTHQLPPHYGAASRPSNPTHCLRRRPIVF